MRTFEEINSYLINELERDPYYSKQLSNVFNNPYLDIDYEFLGFVDTYYHLSNIIPKERVIYDLGCASAIQSWFFRDHKKYVAIDDGISESNIFHTPNLQYYNCSIDSFIASHKIEYPHFAICNYVPPWGADNEDLVRKAFKHMYVFYPCSGDG